jgi:peroxiredoxin
MEKLGTQIGSYAPDFELPGNDGAVHHLARYLAQYQAIGVVFMCNHCPYVRLYLERLKQIQSDFQGQGFTLIGINANDATRFPEDSFDNMKSFAVSNHLNFPYLWDATQDVAHSFGAERTPEVFLIDQQGVLQYTGCIDDSANDAAAVQAPYLRTAIAQVLAGQAVTPVSTSAIGCSVKWRA